MFQALLKKRATNRAYKRAVDDCLSVLFGGFPGLLPTLRRHVDLGQCGGGGEGRCSRLLGASGGPVIRKYRLLSKPERQTRRGLLTGDASNPNYKGFKQVSRR